METSTKLTGRRRTALRAGVAIAVPAGVLVTAAIWLRAFGWGSVNIVNQTNEPVSFGAVEAFSQYYRVPPIAPGKSYRIFYWLEDEGSSKIVLQMKSGRLACGGNGYIDPLLRAHDVLSVTPKGVYLNNPKDVRVTDNCSEDRSKRELAMFAGWRPRSEGARQ